MALTLLFRGLVFEAAFAFRGLELVDDLLLVHMDIVLGAMFLDNPNVKVQFSDGVLMTLERMHDHVNGLIENPNNDVEPRTIAFSHGRQFQVLAIAGVVEPHGFQQINRAGNRHQPLLNRTCRHLQMVVHGVLRMVLHVRQDLLQQARGAQQRARVLVRHQDAQRIEHTTVADDRRHVRRPHPLRIHRARLCVCVCVFMSGCNALLSRMAAWADPTLGKVRPVFDQENDSRFRNVR